MSFGIEEAAKALEKIADMIYEASQETRKIAESLRANPKIDTSATDETEKLYGGPPVGSNR